MSLDLDSLRAVLRVAVLSDVLDGLGLRQQVMRPFVRPLDDGTTILGRARTGRFETVEAAVPGENPYALEIALVDSLAAGEVAVLGCEGPSERICPWGELLSTAAQVRGAVGLVTDALVRDVRDIRRMGFPVFCGGIGALDTKGRAMMTAMDEPVRCGGVQVGPGDIVLADVDGVVVVPREAAPDAIAAALAKIEGEDRTRHELAQGASLADVFARHGIL